MIKLLVVGGLGFIGSHFIRLAASKGCDIINMDAYTYAADNKNLWNPIQGNVKTIIEDITREDRVNAVFRKYGPFDAVVNFAAESHVDNCIKNPLRGIHTNYIGQVHILEAIRKYHPNTRCVFIDTDEVYGEVEDWNMPFLETNVLKPSSPYSASKAAASLMTLAYGRTYNITCIVTRSSNNYGPNQHPEKLLPKAITNLIMGKKIPLYGNGLNARDWLYVTDNCDGIWKALMEGKRGEIYNLGTGYACTNKDILNAIIVKMGKKFEDVVEFVQDRAGHDSCYIIDPSKAVQELGWERKYNLNDGLDETIKWYKDNENWWKDKVR